MTHLCLRLSAICTSCYQLDMESLKCKEGLDTAKAIQMDIVHCRNSEVLSVCRRMSLGSTNEGNWAFLWRGGHQAAWQLR